MPVHAFPPSAVAKDTEVQSLTDLSDVTAKTGSGTTVVMQQSPTLITPTVQTSLAITGAVGTAFISVGNTPATVGNIRLPDQGSLYVRNAANTADLSMLEVVSGSLYLGISSSNLYLASAGTSRWLIDTTQFTPVFDNTQDIGQASFRPRSIYAGTALIVGTSPSSTGAGRFANTGELKWRNAANNADVVGMTVNTTNQVVLGGTNSTAISFSVAALGVIWQITTTGHLIAIDNTYDIGASGATRPRNIYIGTSAVVSGHSAFGSGASVDMIDIDSTATSSIISLKETSTILSGTEPIGIHNYLVRDPAGAATAFTMGILNVVEIPTTNAQTHGSNNACYNIVRHKGSALASGLTGVYGEAGSTSTGGASTINGINGAASNSSTGPTTTIRGVLGTATSSGGATITNHRGGDFSATCSSTSISTNLEAIKALVQHTGTGAVTTARGGRIGISKTSTGAMTTAEVLQAEFDQTNAGSTVDTVRGLSFTGWSNAGTVNTCAVIYADTSVDFGTARWMVHSLSTSPSGFTGHLIQNSTSEHQWTDGAITGTVDLRLARDAANILNQRNGTSAQIFRVANTYTAGTPDLEAFEVNWALTANECYLRTVASGTGTSRILGIKFGNSTTTAVQIPASVGSVVIGSYTTGTTSLIRCTIGGTSSDTATSGTNVACNIGSGPAPSSTSTMVWSALRLNGTINYSAGTPGAGQIKMFYVNPTVTAVPTGLNAAVVLSASASTLGGMHFHNQSDEATNFEYGKIGFVSNAFLIDSVNGGTGTLRAIQIGSADTRNLAFGGAGSFGGGLGVVFIVNANTNPGSNPTGGGILYSNAGAGTWRGSGGTVTAFGPAGPHCERCGYDEWTVASLNVRWKSWRYECGHCGAVYAGGPQEVHKLLDDQQQREYIRKSMRFEDVAKLLKVA